MIFTFKSIILSFVISISHGCVIQGTDSGICTEQTLDAIWRQENMPFCQDAVLYAACVPAYQVSFIHYVFIY
jgi:hypothetical protein